MSEELTRPHDYRALLEACPDFTIVGGQAIAAWAITYLDAEQSPLEGFGSHDLDVIARQTVSEIIAALPNWKHDRPPLWAFTETRLLKLASRDPDGRLLIVEVLSKVNGLSRKDIEAVEELDLRGQRYRLLDPIAMLKAKAANVRELDQEGPPRRQDRAHLQIIARCVAPFLRDAHAQAVEDPTLQPKLGKTVSRAFRTLSARRTLRTLLVEGIEPLSLLPTDLGESPIAKVRSAFDHQLPRLVRQVSDTRAK